MRRGVPSSRGLIRRALDLLATELHFRQRERHLPHYRLAAHPPDYSALPIYPIDMSPLLAMPFGGLDESGVLYNAATSTSPGNYQPTSIAQFALASWNEYLATGVGSYRDVFLRQAHWLLSHEVQIDGGVGAWPIDFAVPKYGAQAGWLSALTQGNVISVFVRAYKLTGDARFIEASLRAVRTFQRDIFDGGVSTPVGSDGIFFEEVAAYPAAHVLNGFLLGLFGLYDYVAVSGDVEVEKLIQRSMRTLHDLLDHFDTGYWTRYDLLHGRVATRFYHALHIALMQALAWYSGCEHCAALARRWQGYQQGAMPRLRYRLASRWARYSSALTKLQRYLRRPRRRPADPTAAPTDLVSVPVTAFPVAGGVRSVLASVAPVMADVWHCEYLTRQIGADRQGLTIYGFGGRLASPRYTLTAWLYTIAGRRKLSRLVRSGHVYRYILPQDGLFSGVFAVQVGRARGIRVVVMDHGTVTLPFSPIHRAERLAALKQHMLPVRLALRVGLIGFWPALATMARITARGADHFLVAGEEVEEVYRQRLGVAPNRITRYPYAVDLSRFIPPSPSTQAELRRQLGIPTDVVVITMINRLAPEKGLDVAMQGIGQAVSALPAELRAHVRVVIAGDGPLRRAVEADSMRFGLGDICWLYGEAGRDDVTRLLAISDIFLYTGTRGTNFSMAVLEAMAAGCAVIASTEPRSNAQVLAGDRGVAIPVGDAGAVGQALAWLIQDTQVRTQMGVAARAYVEQYHSAEALRRCLLRATGWPGWSGGQHVSRDKPVDAQVPLMVGRESAFG